MRVEDIMRRAPITVTVDDDIGLVAERMAWAGIHHVPVLDGGRLVGLVSERDVAIYGARHGHLGLSRSVDTIMRRHPKTAGPHETVPEIAARMAAEEVDCFPITVNDALVGILTTTDLLLAHAEPVATPVAPVGETLVRDVMTADPVTAHPDDYLLDAAATMHARGVRHLPVIDGERTVLGLLSEAEVRAAVGNPAVAFGASSAGSLRAVRVGVAMVPRPLTISAEQTVHDAAVLFVHRSATALLVVDSAAKLVGILSYIDLLRVLARA